MVKKSLTVEFSLDSTKSWVADGSRLNAISDADFPFCQGTMIRAACAEFRALI